MPNSYFKFKKFTIHQQYCAMKVCTDACLFGAWLAAHTSNDSAIKNILDIGTGTGLLSLMLAQKNTAASIDAVEIYTAAAAQAKQNIEASPWQDRITVINEAVQEFVPVKSYDLVVCNPPFYKNHLKSNDASRNIALHSSQLSFEDLFGFVNTHLNGDGVFAMLVPFSRAAQITVLAKLYHFYPCKIAGVRQTPAHSCFRSMFCFSREKTPVIEEEVIIKDLQGRYTPSFIHLLKDYYLQL